jgi:hypothetical protein
MQKADGEGEKDLLFCVALKAGCAVMGEAAAKTRRTLMTPTSRDGQRPSRDAAGEQFTCQ